MRLRPFSIVLGVLVIPLVSLWVAAIEEVYGGRPTYLSIFFHAVLILIGLAAVNALLRRVLPRLAFTRAELLLLYVMLGISGGPVGEQFLPVLLPSLAHPFHYATEANHWAERLQPHLPLHAMVSDPVAVRNFYLGESSFYLRQNFLPWLWPSLQWAAFLAALQLMCLAVNVLMRRQWTDYERLSFPLVELPLYITATGRSSIWRNNLMWIGFAAAGAVNLINGLHYHYPALPALSVKLKPVLWPGRWGVPFTSVYTSFYPFIIGIAFLLPVELTFSTWFFFIFSRLQRALFMLLGFPTPYPWSTTDLRSSPPAIVEQSIGAYLAVVVFALWAARRHLRGVGQALREGALTDRGSRAEAITPGETQEYRVAVGTLLCGLAFTTWFAGTVGMPPVTGFFYVLFYLVLCTAIAKIRAEAGAPTHGFHMAGPDRILLSVLGTRHMPVREMAAWGLFWGFNRSYTGVPAPHQLEGMKIGELAGAERRPLLVAETLATVMGVLAAFWALLHLCYRHGVEHRMLGPVQWMSGQGWAMVDSWMSNPSPPNWGGLVAIAFGFGFASLLMFLRLRFIWWPFHPIGYALAPDWTVGTIWLPLLIGQMAKSAVMRYSGHKTYRVLVPVAVGLILGEFVIGGGWEVLALLLREPQYAFWQ